MSKKDPSSLNELLETRDLYYKFKKLHEKAQSDIDEKKAELAKLQEENKKIAEELKDKMVELGTVKVSLDKDKEMKDTLMTQLDELKAKYQKFEDEAEKLKDSVSNKEQTISEKDQQLAEKDKVIRQKDEKLEELNEKVLAQVSKITELQDQVIDLQKRNEELKLKEKDLQKEIETTNSEYDALKVRLRNSGDSVLGTTMELEKMNNEIKEKDERINELESKLGSILTGASGFLTSRDKLIDKFKEMVGRTHRSIRMCIPSLGNLEEISLLSTIQDFPSTIVVNIAADVPPTDEHILMNLKPKGVNFTQFDQKDRWVLNRDGEELIIALEKDDGSIIGLYSNEQKLLSMFNSAIMEPWVKGMKI